MLSSTPTITSIMERARFAASICRGTKWWPRSFPHGWSPSATSECTRSPSATPADGERVHSEVAEGLHPCGKDRGHHFVPLQIDAANLARSIIDVIVGVELSMLREGLHYFRIGEMLLYIGARPE